MTKELIRFKIIAKRGRKKKDVGSSDSGIISFDTGTNRDGGGTKRFSAEFKQSGGREVDNAIK